VMCALKGENIKEHPSLQTGALSPEVGGHLEGQ
jgi:hypothetical protein